MKPPKLRGELAELAFLLKAASLGLSVSRPYGDSAPFDFIVLSDTGKLSRVQIKSAAALAQRRYYIINSKLGRSRPYDRSHIDFLVAYLVPEDSWYILPPRIFLGRRQLAVPCRVPQVRAPGLGANLGTCRRNRFLPYREAWDQLFDLRAPGFTLHACADTATGR